MKLRRVVEVKVTSYEEQQFILTRFPDAIWMVDGTNTRFYLDEEKIAEIVDAVDEFNGKENK